MEKVTNDDYSKYDNKKEDLAEAADISVPTLGKREAPNESSQVASEIVDDVRTQKISQETTPSPSKRATK